MSASPQADVYPSLAYRDAPAAIAWLCSAFGFVQRFVHLGEEGRVEHSELTFGNAVIMVSSVKPELGYASPETLGACTQGLSLYVQNPDAHHAQALAAGATLVRALQDEPYGARGYLVRDPEGHPWYFGNYRPGAYWQ